MYYVIVPQELCERRRVFSRNQRTPDGRVVLTLRDLNLTRFSYGPVEIVNGDDLQLLMRSRTARVETSDSSTENNDEE